MNEKLNNIVSFKKPDKKDTVFRKWRQELKQNHQNNNESTDGENQYLDLNNNFKLLRDSWSPEYDNLLQEYLEDNQNEKPTLHQFMDFLKQNFEKYVSNEIKNSEISLTNEVSLIFDDQNRTIQEGLERLFGEIDFEILGLEKGLILIQWKQRYDDLVEKYMTNGELEEHITDLQQFLKEIRNTYQEYKNNEKNTLEFYMAKLFLQAQKEIEFYKSKI